MNLSPAEFWPLSFRDWLLKQRGFFDMKNAEYRDNWERTRMAAFYAIAPWNKAIRTPQDVFRFDWEKVEHFELTEEQMDYFLRKVGKYIDKDGRSYNA